MARRAQPWFGTLVEISVNEDAAATLDAGFAVIGHVHALMSFHDAASDVSKLNTATIGACVSVHEHTMTVLTSAKALHDQSGGLFNICVGRSLVQNGFLPRMSDAHLAQYAGRMRDIELLEDNTMRINKPILIDLGGIAKGYGVDLAVSALIAAGATSGIVNAGGDLRVFGDEPMLIDIRQSDGIFAAPLLLKNCAIASSHNMDSRRTVRGAQQTPHIDQDGQSVTIDYTISVVAQDCMTADALTKVAMLNPRLAHELSTSSGGYLVDYAPHKAMA